MKLVFNDKQKQIVRDLKGKEYKNICLCGGGRSGKTTFLMWATLTRAIKEPLSNHIILRDTRTSMKSSILRGTLQKLLNFDNFKNLKTSKGFKINYSELSVTLPNGSIIYCVGLNDDRATERILGNEYSTIYFNECSSLDYSRIVLAKSRLAEKNNLSKKIFYDFNPPTKNHWTYKVFVERKNPDNGSLLTNAGSYFVAKLNPVDNLENIDSGYIEEQKAGGAGHYKRFVEGEFTEEAQGVLFTNNMLTASKNHQFDDLEYDYFSDFLDVIVIGVDPAVTNSQVADLTGIVVVGKKREEYFVLEDATGRYSPKDWAVKIDYLYKKWRANYVIGETNQGGDLVESNIHNINDTIAFEGVRATNGKRLRAEPVATLYDQGRVKHIQYYKGNEFENKLQMLESQMLEFSGSKKDKSPDRLDALVYAITFLTGEMAPQSNITVLSL